MVDLNRQIRVTQARQGGFSAHVLPAAVKYAEFPQVIAYFTTNSIQVIGEYNSFSVSEGVEYSATGGPFGEPCGTVAPFGPSGTYQIELGNSSPGAGDFTMEFWFQGNEAQGGDVVELSGEGGYSLVSYSNFEGSSTQNWTVRHAVTASGAINIRQTKSPAIPGFTWIHVAVARSGTNHNIYVAGSLVTNVITPGQEWEPINLSNQYIYASRRGKLGQLRYTQGTALYSGTTITVPTGPFISV